MAWRIDKWVTSGTIDNREKGVVKGELYLRGLKEPVIFSLKGNPHKDIAGAFFEFSRKEESKAVEADPEKIKNFNIRQEGIIGDFTASKRRKVPSIPKENWEEVLKNKTPLPFTWKNTLYLEWFDDDNGRVVLESADFNWKIGLPEWQMSDAEEVFQKESNENAMEGFMKSLADDYHEEARSIQSEEEQVFKSAGENQDEWNEFQAEKFLKCADRRAESLMEKLNAIGDIDKIQEALDKFFGGIAESSGLRIEMKVVRPEDIMKDDASDEDEPPADLLELPEKGPQHPLGEKAMAFVNYFMKTVNGMPIQVELKEALNKLTGSIVQIGVKLQGILNSYEGKEIQAGMTIAQLKRLIDLINQSFALLQNEEWPKDFLELPAITETKPFLMKTREEILNIMNEIRTES